MATKTFAGKIIEINEEGYLVNASEWTPDVAKEIAAEEGIELTDLHFRVLDFIRDKAGSGVALTIRSIGNSGIIDIKQFYQLFPGGPLKKASRIAGIKKPSSCV
ncbi:MAG TPA: TusE/DsrC/DsvC family sulfur relay protein [Bacteroidales bacterium]|nr:TusE/DsrC/DsvC family sulfur relay protein [Bacteroidales bacterium]